MTREQSEKIAKSLHEAYVRLTPLYGYEPQVPWDQLENNQRELKIAAVIAVFTDYVPPYPA